MITSFNVITKAVMQRRQSVFWVGLCLTIVSPNEALSAKESPAADEFVITYLMLLDDDYYEPPRAYTGLVLKAKKRPLNGAQLGIKEAKVVGRSIGVKFALEEITLSSGDDKFTRIEESLSKSGSKVVIVDLPKPEMLEVVSHFQSSETVVLNVRHSDDDLRNELCAENLFHIVPSNAMLTDALVQYLVSKNWKKYLILQGPLEEDVRLTQAFTRSARKFGGKIVSRQSFVLSNNPRDRSQTNVTLMTGKPAHDIVFVADTFGEFSRYIPYQTYFSRLVAGSEGLRSSAWHWTWERYGAPQLNQRYKKLAQARMSSADWAGWASVKSIVSVVAKTRSQVFKNMHDMLSSNELTLDLYKGMPGSFRAWNNQLRQPILLHTHNAVVTSAPMEEFLHHVNNLDSLGVDEPESGCHW